MIRPRECRAAAGGHRGHHAAHGAAAAPLRGSAARYHGSCHSASRLQQILKLRDGIPRSAGHFPED